MKRTRSRALICCLGNPIGADDSVGCLVGRYLQRIIPARRATVIPEYGGSALDFVLDIENRQKVLVVDAVTTGKLPPGSVRLFSEKEICGQMIPSTFHGVNLPQAIVMARKLKLEMPEIIKLIGIEIRPVASFGERLSLALKRKLPVIRASVMRILVRELKA